MYVKILHPINHDQKFYDRGIYHIGGALARFLSH